MILQALNAFYNELEEKGKVAPWGLAPAPISAELHIKPNGEIARLLDLRNEVAVKKKTVLRPQELQVPFPALRTVNVASNFLWDNAQYIFGLDYKNNPKKARKCFASACELHISLLSELNSPIAKAIVAYFSAWNSAEAVNHILIENNYDLLSSGANVLLCDENGNRATNDEEIRQAWLKYYDSQGSELSGVCAITGKRGSIELTHPSIKGIPGTQAKGGSIVSYNAPAFESYGWSQSQNASISRAGAFGYTSALNKLLSDRERVVQIGDTSVVFWAQNAEETYQDLMKQLLMTGYYSEADLRGVLEHLLSGRRVKLKNESIDPNMRFYILGLSPNAGRISVRFFLQDTFGAFLKNVAEHHERMRIFDANGGADRDISVWQLVNATVNQKSKDKKASSILVGELVQSILNNTRYPASLLNGIQIRIRAERKINHTRAAAIKAYYSKNRSSFIPKEVLSVEVNQECTNVPYVLGRLFSLYEGIQKSAIRNITTTITDKYFTSAAATPAVIFPMLNDLARKHLRKIHGDRPGLAIFYEKRIAELTSCIGDHFPAHMNLPEQGAFQLGYYGESQARFKKEEESEEDKKNGAN